ncbi:phytanoyl-CoA dioxygenase [Vibrio parahaemolyticus]|uniref:phytanoyl-CoA dioxygenase family protein n=1 Tax=Vibrio parahaemolyticus TaxID=670 RepID=UPI001124578C|nr:phytanoyl-CoA dioxygenase family protein [Vibrio parahaemolyticus]TNZ67671.1 phytanoyl-CoA dioxygenase [Vibrio parahaemolyticus]
MKPTQLECEFLEDWQLEFLPTEDDINHYRERGWWISGKVLDLEDIDDALFGVQRLLAGETDFSLPIALSTSNAASGELGIRQIDYLSLQIIEFERLVHQPIIGAMAARLTGDSTIRLFHDQLVQKLAQASGKSSVVGWHTDRAYWQTCTSSSMLTAWVPLTSATKETGTLMVLDQSHKWMGNEELHNFHDQDIKKSARFIHGLPKSCVPISYEVEPGQICFHHCLTVHGSENNESQNDRLAFSIHLQDGSNSFRRYFRDAERAAVHLNDLLCKSCKNGEPDYSDPEICPELWPPRHS